MDEDRDSKGSHWVKIICISISGLAFVGVAHHYFLRGEEVAVEHVREGLLPISAQGCFG